MRHVPDESRPVEAIGPSDDATLDIEYLEDRADAEADPADLIDQAIEIPLAEDDRE